MYIYMMMMVMMAMMMMMVMMVTMMMMMICTYIYDDDDPHIQQDLRQKPQIYLLKPPIRCVKGPHFGFFAEWPEKHPETETMALSEKRGLDRPNKNTWKELTQQKTVNLT